MSEEVLLAKLRRDLVARGCPPDQAAITADWGLRAANDGFDAVGRTLARNPGGGFQPTAAGIAISVLIEFLQTQLASLQKFSADTGLNTEVVTVDLRQ